MLKSFDAVSLWKGGFSYDSHSQKGARDAGEHDPEIFSSCSAERRASARSKRTISHRREESLEASRRSIVQSEDSKRNRATEEAWQIR